MKKIFPFLIILISISQINCFSQAIGFAQEECGLNRSVTSPADITGAIGFAQEECGLITNLNYHYENYWFPPDGAGYKLYHNGNIIKQDEYIMQGFTAAELKFIDDTTGFFIVINNIVWSLEIYKIINNSVIYIGSGSGNRFNSFVVSRHTIYVSSYPSSSNYDFLFITRCSDLMPEKELLSMDTIVPDTTFYDTISGQPLCLDLNQIDYLYRHYPDTLVYTIQFIIDTLTYISQENEPSYIIFPNPVSDFIHINSPSNEKFKSIIILDNLGRKKKYLMPDSTSEQVIYIGDLDNGVYFLIIENSIKNSVYKFIKI